MGVSLAGLNDFLPRELLTALEQTVDNAVNLGTSGLQANQSASLNYSSPSSFQMIAGDLDLAAGAGKNVPDTAFLGGVMGNVIGNVALTKTGNYLGGVIGHFNCPGVLASHYPAGAVLAGIGDGVSEAKGAVVAYIDGDSAQTNAGAAFKVMSNNSTAASGFDFGVDLQDAAHDGYQAVDAAFYKKSQVRLTEDVCIKVGSGVPVDGIAGTGAGTMGPGSLFIDSSGAEVYINDNTKASPTWKAITHA